MNIDTESTARLGWESTWPLGDGHWHSWLHEASWSSQRNSRVGEDSLSHNETNRWLFIVSVKLRGTRLHPWINQNFGARCHLLIILVQTLQNSCTVKTDDAVQKFDDVFATLKQCFWDRLNLDSWKIACTMKDGVLCLITTTDQIKEISKHRNEVILS